MWQDRMTFPNVPNVKHFDLWLFQNNVLCNFKRTSRRMLVWNDCFQSEFFCYLFIFVGSCTFSSCIVCLLQHKVLKCNIENIELCRGACIVQMSQEKNWTNKVEMQGKGERDLLEMVMKQKEELFVEEVEDMQVQLQRCKHFRMPKSNKHKKHAARMWGLTKWASYQPHHHWHIN